MPADTCYCGKKIEVAIFRGTGTCSVNCKKKYKGDTSSVGTFMFVTIDEKNKIMEERNG